MIRILSSTLSLMALVTAFSSLSSAATDVKREKVNLIVEVKTLKISKGSVLISVFRGPRGFPADPKAAIAIRKQAATAGTVNISFQLEPGTYAIAVAHDINDNGEVDTNILGIPTEPIGFSKNPTLSFGAPSFDETKFTVAGPETKTSIILKTFL